MVFQWQREHIVIFTFGLHRNTIQGNSGLPFPQLTDLIYTLISTTSSHPLGIFKSRHVQDDLELER
jgi:hypothetical protein